MRMAHATPPPTLLEHSIIGCSPPDKNDLALSDRFVVKKLPDYSGLLLLCAALQSRSCHYPGLRYVRKHGIFVQRQARHVASGAHCACDASCTPWLTKAVDRWMSLWLGISGRNTDYFGHPRCQSRRQRSSHRQWPCSWNAAGRLARKRCTKATSRWPSPWMEK